MCGVSLGMWWAVVAVVAAAVRPASGLDNGLARLPPMGWANWNGFGCNYNDTTIRAMADALVATGMRDAGYRTLIIQECIVPAGHRDAKGVLQPDPKKFPFGMKDLVDYLHSKGLLAGIYTDVGPETCAGYEGSFGHEAIDAQTFAGWGIDFVEEDSCHHPAGHPYRELYGRMRDALNATGRPIVFYSCVQGQEDVEQWGPSTANLWRTTGDICSPGHASYARMVSNFDGNSRHPNITAPGQWQDPDMLVVGMPGLTEVEWRTHFNLWAISAAPLWSGIDLTAMNASVLAIFMNKDVIAVDQDPRGMMGRRAAGHRTPGPMAGHRRRGGRGLPDLHEDSSAALGLVPCASAPTFAYTAANESLSAPSLGCLTIESCSTAAGGHVITYACVGDKGGCPTNQQFAFVNASGGRVQLQSKISSLCVTAGNTMLGEARAVQEPCTGSASQLWTVSGNPSPIQLGDSGLCLGPAPPVGEAWVKPLTPAASEKLAVAVLLFNRNEVRSNATVTAAELGLDPGAPAHARDLWAHTTSTFPATWTIELAPHDSQMLRVSQ